MAVALLTLFAGAPYQPLDNTGHIVPGGKLTFYEAGTNILQDTYTNAAGTIPSANPVILDAYGRASIYLATTPAYDVKFALPSNVEVWFQENVIANAPAS